METEEEVPTAANHMKRFQTVGRVKVCHHLELHRRPPSPLADPRSGG